MARTGKIKVFIDTAEHKQMDELFEQSNEFLGGILQIERKTLQEGDYMVKAEGQEPIIFTFKEYGDFKQSFFSGHLMDEILAMNMAYPNSAKALIIARNRLYRYKRDMLIWVDTHYLKRNFLIPTFKFGSREKAVEFMVDCALKADSLQWLERSVRRAPDLNQVAGLYSFYGVGRDKAEALAERFPKPADLFKAMADLRTFEEATGYWEDSNRKWEAHLMPKAWKDREGKRLTKGVYRDGRWWSGILGETTAVRIEEFILDGKEIPIKRRTNG